MKQYSTFYIFAFSAALCLGCSLVISLAYVGLKDRQDENRLLDKQRSVLLAAHLIEASEKDRAVIQERFAQVKPVVVDLASGDVVADVDAEAFDVAAAEMVAAPPNNAQVLEVPKQTKLYQVMDGDKVDMLVLPIEGKGLWGTLYGFMAVDAADCNTVQGITYYDHKETPGLGGEVDNPKWKGLWVGRKIYDGDGDVAIAVIKGKAGSAAEDPHHVDGLAGATLTSRGVSNMMKFWFSENGYGPYLAKFKQNGSA